MKISVIITILLGISLMLQSAMANESLTEQQQIQDKVVVNNISKDLYASLQIELKAIKMLIQNDENNSTEEERNLAEVKIEELKEKMQKIQSCLESDKADKDSFKDCLEENGTIIDQVIWAKYN